MQRNNVDVPCKELMVFAAMWISFGLRIRRKAQRGLNSYRRELVEYDGSKFDTWGYEMTARASVSASSFLFFFRTGAVIREVKRPAAWKS